MTHSLPKRITLLLILSLIAFAFLASRAIAAKNTFVPGWGFGDTNNVHVGPPGGPSVHPVFQSNETSISNSVNISTNTGGNSGNGTSGNVTTNVNISNVGGSNIVQ